MKLGKIPVELAENDRDWQKQSAGRGRKKGEKNSSHLKAGRSRDQLGAELGVSGNTARYDGENPSEDCAGEPLTMQMVF